jgi:hypothetical protein
MERIEIILGDEIVWKKQCFCIESCLFMFLHNGNKKIESRIWEYLGRDILTNWEMISKEIGKDDKGRAVKD